MASGWDSMHQNRAGALGFIVVTVGTEWPGRTSVHMTGRLPSFINSQFSKVAQTRFGGSAAFRTQGGVGLAPLGKAITDVLII